MTANTVAVTEAVRHFSDYINRVAYRHEAFILQKGNKAMAELRPVPSGLKKQKELMASLKRGIKDTRKKRGRFI